jgi:hypothetical protein
VDATGAASGNARIVDVASLIVLSIHRELSRNRVHLVSASCRNANPAQPTEATVDKRNARCRVPRRQM